MPRPRKTEEDRRAEIFIRNYKIGKAKIGFLDPDVARVVGITERTLSEKKKAPGKLRVEQMVTLGKVFGWSDEDFMRSSGWKN